MNNIFKITCPKCKKIFDAGSAFNAHIESTKKEEAKKAEKEAEKKFKSQLESKDKEIKKTRKEEAKKAEALATQKYKSQLESKDKEIEKTRKEAEEKAKIDASKDLEKKYIKKLQEKEDALEKSKKAQEITEKRLSERTKEMNDIMEQRKVELQGEIQEERLQDYLKKLFPEDDVEEIKKGAKGGDCIQTINYKGKQNVAKIYFESKDTKTFNEQWANKLLRDMKAKEISNGIIVVSPSCMPSDLDQQKSYVERHGNVITIIPMFKPIIHAVVNRVRSILIMKSRENKDHEIPEIMKKCWQNLNSPKFMLPLREMVSEIKIMQDHLEKDRTSFDLSISRKEKTIKNIKQGLTDMVTSFIANVDRDIFPANILIAQDKNKKLIDRSD